LVVPAIVDSMEYINKNTEQQNNGSHRHSYKDCAEGVRSLYVNDNLSLKEIGERLNLNPDTISRWLKKSGVKIKTAQERRTPEQQQEIVQKISQTKTGVQWNEKQHQARPKKEVIPKSKIYQNCINCGAEFSPSRPNVAKYCENCRTSKIYRKTFDENYSQICPCGNKTGKKNKKYCSTKCRSLYGEYPELKTKSAICVGCGQEFTKPAYYPSAMKYCSNKCSHHEVKSVRDKYVLELNDKAVVFHSMWEMRFAAACERHNIPWRRYDGEDIITPLGNHRPDFIVSELEYIVEIKGQFDFEDMIKSEKVKEIYGKKYTLLFEEELKYFEENGILISIDPRVPVDIANSLLDQLKEYQRHIKDNQ
jgi:predicted DNA-binding protein YlxM (UPF0122 family)